MFTIVAIFYYFPILTTTRIAITTLNPKPEKEVQMLFSSHWYFGVQLLNLSVVPAVATSKLRGFRRVNLNTYIVYLICGSKLQQPKSPFLDRKLSIPHTNLGNSEQGH